MSTFYRCGPNSHWAGVVELFEDGKSYIHHTRWPERRHQNAPSILSNHIDYYTAGGFWKVAEDLNYSQVDPCL